MKYILWREFLPIILGKRRNTFHKNESHCFTVSSSLDTNLGQSCVAKIFDVGNAAWGNNQEKESDVTSCESIGILIQKRRLVWFNNEAMYVPKVIFMPGNGVQSLEVDRSRDACERECVMTELFFRRENLRESNLVGAK